MNEPKKSVLALIIVMGILLFAYIMETIRDSWPKLFGKLSLGLVISGLVAIVILIGIHFAHARDDGRYAASPLKQWFDHLRSGKGQCCSDADGSAVSDVDWESKEGHYRVRIPKDAGSTDLEWIDVPDDALITEPNRAGRTMVWPVYSPTNYGVYITIRCFMPGSMT